MKVCRKKLCISTALLTAFILWTVAVCFVDVQPIGPNGSNVGFANMNLAVHSLTGVHFTLYAITDWLSLVPVAVCAGFGGLGLYQWMTRKKLLKVDRDILALGCYYLIVFAVYLLFERFVINYRPVLIQGVPEASYPSSTTLLVLCVMPTAILQLQKRMRHSLLKQCVIPVIILFILFMVLGRLLSGVHWLSDIIGGVLLSTGLVMMYYAVL